MPLYLVTHYCPNGNTVSGVVSHFTADAAIDQREAEMGIHDTRAEGFDVDCRPLADPDGDRARRWDAAEERLRHDRLCR